MWPRDKPDESLHCFLRQFRTLASAAVNPGKTIESGLDGLTRAPGKIVGGRNIFNSRPFCLKQNVLASHAARGRCSGNGKGPLKASCFNFVFAETQEQLVTENISIRPLLHGEVDLPLPDRYDHYPARGLTTAALEVKDRGVSTFADSERRYLLMGSWIPAADPYSYQN